MIKRILAILLIAVLAFGDGIVFAEEFTPILNEVFDDYETGAGADSDTSASNNIKVTEYKKCDKGFFANLSDSTFRYVRDFEAENVKSIVYSSDIKITEGKVSGAAFTIGTAPLLNFEKSGRIVLSNGYYIGGYSDGKWHRYSVVINYTTDMYDVYVDNKMVISHIQFAGGTEPNNRIVLTFKPDGVKPSKVWVDNIRVYEGNEPLPDSAFPDKPYNDEVIKSDGAITEETQSSIYVDGYADKGITLTTDKGDNDENFVGFDYPENSDTKAMRFYQKGTLNVIGNFAVPTSGDDIDSFVCQFRLLLTKNVTGKGYVRMGGQSGNYYLARFNAATSTLTSNGVNICKLDKGKWIDVAVAVDIILGKANYYINGNLAAEDVLLEGAVVQVPTSVRLGFASVSSTGGNNEFFVDCFKVYSGSKLIDFDDETRLAELAALKGAENSSLNFNSILEQESDAKSYLANNSLFMLNNDYYYSKGEKKRYSDFGSAAYMDENSVAMVPAALVEEALSTKITLDGTKITTPHNTAELGSRKSGGGELDAAPVLKDGVLFIPLASFTEKVLGKYAYINDHDYVMASNNPMSYVDIKGSNNNTQDIDVIYRYMQFDNPTGDQIYADMFKNGAPTRPAFLVNAEQLKNVRAKVEMYDEFKKSAIAIVDGAEALISAPLVEWEIYDGLRLLNRCHDVNEVVHTLTVAYLLTDDTKYLDRLWKEIKHILVEWPDLNMPGALSKENTSSGGGHMLDAGTISEGLAIAYDVLYDYLSKSEKQLMKEKYQEKALDYFVGVFNGTSGFTAKDSRLRSSNWGAVIGGGMFMVAMSMMASETDENSIVAQKCKFVAENAFKLLRFPLHNFFPDGAIKESIGYYGFYLAGLGYSQNAMMNFCGTDYGFSNAPGWDAAPEFIVYIQSLNGTYNFGSSSDSDHLHTFYDETFLVANIFDNMEQMKVLNYYRKKLGKAYSGVGLLFAEPTDTDDFEVSLPLDKHYGDTFQIMRGDWTDKNSVFVGITEGLNGESGQFDKGSFIFESDSIRWFSDLGGDNAYVAGGYYSQNGWTLYRRRSEGHNCLIINATNDGYPEQRLNSQVKKTNGQSKPKGAFATFDMTDVYGYKNTGVQDVTSYKRGFLLTDNRYSLIVQDELELAKPNSTFHSFFHVTENGVITINPDGKSATVEKNGEILDFTVICDADEWKLEKWDAVYIDPSMDRNLLTDDPSKMEKDRSSISKIAIVGKDSGKLNISVKMSVRNKGRDYEEHTFVPMDSWSIAEGELPKYPYLDSVSINGLNYDNFENDRTSYTIPLSSNGTPANLEAQSSSGNVEITQPQTLEDMGHITVTNADGYKRIYHFAFRYPSMGDGVSLGEGMPINVKFADIKMAEASDTPQSENPASNAVDGDIATKWAGDTAGDTFTVDIGEVTTLAGVAISFSSGAKRAYSFDVSISDDGVNYTKVYSGISLKSELDYEFLYLNTTARYVRYTGFGSDVNAWNNLREFRPCVYK